MADQENTAGFARAFLPGLVLGVLIGAGTTFAYFTFSESGEMPKISNQPRTDRPTGSRERGDIVDPNPGDPTLPIVDAQGEDDPATETPPADGDPPSDPPNNPEGG